MSKRGLGKGLDALIQTNRLPEGEFPKPDKEVDIVAIVPNPFQPRKVFDSDSLADLVQSIKQYGILQPLVLRKTLEGYQLVVGERRWRAAKQIGLKTVPALIRELDDGEMAELALIENLQRENLNPMEEGYSYKQLMEQFGLTQEEVSRRIGKSRSHIANMMRLLQLSPQVQDYVSRGTLTMGQVRPLIPLTDENLQLEAAELIVEEDLSARDAEKLVKKFQAGKQEKFRSELTAKQVEQDFFLNQAEDQLKMHLGTLVKIKQGKAKGKIEIEFTNQDELERILEMVLEKSNKETKAGTDLQKFTV